MGLWVMVVWVMFGFFWVGVVGCGCLVLLCKFRLGRCGVIFVIGV